MGTGRPQVEIAAATLAGGGKNQDRYAYGDGWAFVLDGASSFAKTKPEHDGGWYAEHLKQALTAGLANDPERPTPSIVEDAIRTLAEVHGGNVASCPTSTIALARWDGEVVETYLLGDSTAVFISAEGEEVLGDARLAAVACALRSEYRSRLSAGHGFDERHQGLLQQLQTRQSAARNRSGGYWIAGAEPDAANHAVAEKRPLGDVQSLVLATDGAASGARYGVFPTWEAFAAQRPDQVLQLVHDAEARDRAGARWPRSKPHDDKTAVVLRFLD